MALEIERRLLLKRFPRNNYSEIHEIQQFYGPTGRLRRVEIFINNQISPIIKYIRTKKKTISKGVNEEIESEISKVKFDSEFKKCTKYIKKTRYIKMVGKYKWEIDVFSDCSLVIAEVEVKTKKELKTVPIPKFIKNNMLLDITGVKIFSNFNLADDWKFKK